MAGQPRVWAGVGPAKAPSNQALVTGEKAASGSTSSGYRPVAGRTSVPSGAAEALGRRVRLPRARRALLHREPGRERADCEGSVRAADGVRDRPAGAGTEGVLR